MRAAPAGGRLLLLGGDVALVACVREAARRIGASLDEASDTQTALALLLRPQVIYSHLLLPPGLDAASIDDLLGLSSEDIRNEPLLLGAQPAKGWNAQHLPVPSLETLVPALAAPAAPQRRIRLGAAALSAALQDGSLRVRYQPIVDAGNLQPRGFEALARLHHPQHGILAPASFILALQDIGVARQLFTLVLEATLAGAAPVLNGTGLALSMNISLPLLQEAELADQLVEACRRHGFDRRSFLLELTERHPPPEEASLRPAMDRLRDRSFGIAIDDAGPAQPHWRALITLPFTHIKLDKSMVRGAEHGADAAGIIEASHAAALLVVAEGIENRAIQSRMVKLGADLLQGFLFARPMPAAALRAWLEAAGVPN